MNKIQDTGSSPKTRQMTQTYSFFNIFDNSATNREGLKEIQLRGKNWMTSDKPDMTLPFRAYNFKRLHGHDNKITVGQIEGDNLFYLISDELFLDKGLTQSSAIKKSNKCSQRHNFPGRSCRATGVLSLLPAKINQKPHIQNGKRASLTLMSRTLPIKSKPNYDPPLHSH